VHSEGERNGLRDSGVKEPTAYSRQPTVREKQGGKSGGEYSPSPLIPFDRLATPLSLGGERKIREWGFLRGNFSQLTAEKAALSMRVAFWPEGFLTIQ
jgi:hypothetical protein